MVWRVKTSENCKVAFTTVQTTNDAWYFDSGCSRHMTGKRSFFSELKEYASGHVTFGDGAKGRIIAKGNIDKNNLPCLSDVRYVDGLKANLVKLGHISLRSLDKVIRNEAVVGIPTIDINGSMKTESLGEKKYVLVVVDDYSRFTWVQFFKGKSDTVQICIRLCLNLQREKGKKIIRIYSDHAKEFDNEDLNNFYQIERIHHEFSAPKLFSKMESVERKNRTLQEMARVMIHPKNLPLHFLAEAINTACHIHNRITTRSGMTVTLYELWNGRKLNVKYFHVFGNTCYILADREYHRKWDVKLEQGIFLEYSHNSCAYRVFNIKSGIVMETINVVVNDFESTDNQINDEDDETVNIPVDNSLCSVEVPKADALIDGSGINSEKISKEVIADNLEFVPSTHVKKNHPSSSIIGDPPAKIITQKKEKVDYLKMIADLCYTFAIKPSTIDVALKDEYWINVMQEELLQFMRNNV
ncbi:gag-pol polyprotein [Cucumis melo var. makuwa]|uniref:Gag-pol polyprotein n=1 Tax=Cucumis melo var. makuwa TaxID=1194695 RepID=A0A5A7VAS8_CUCMM|nr:gag-pol polyprotein [Cucumis melo var. makuwa]TYK28621.1 gag-pol polyprotein [Cucumis melo var. makuwa]